MKTIHIYFLLISISIGSLLFSCSKNRSGIDTIILTTSFEESSRPVSSTHINLEKEFIYAKQYYIYNDSILIVVNKPSRENKFIELWNMKGHNIVGSYFTLGNGPGEMLLVQARLDGNTLIVRDIQKGQVSFLEIDSILFNDNYEVKVIKHEMMTPDINRDQFGNLIYENPFCFTNKEYSIDNDVNSRFLIGDESFQDKSINNYRFNTFNISQGILVSKSDKSKYFHCSYYHPYIEIYDKNLMMLRKIIIDDDDLKKQEFITTNSENSSFTNVAFSTTIPYAFRGICASENYVFVSYIGKLYAPTLADLTSPYPKSINTSYIMKFDWDGNLIDSYKYDGYINSISIGSDESTIYATSYNEDAVPILIKIPLP